MEDSKTGFPHFYMEEMRDNFGSIAGQGFHTFTMKRIWVIFRGIAGQGFHIPTMKSIWTILGGSKTGFPHFYNDGNLDYFGRIAR